MSDVFDLDGMTDEPESKSPLDNIKRTDRKFLHKGFDCVEVIYQGWKPGVNKLVWCVDPLDKTLVQMNGKPRRNYLFHAEYQSSSAEGLQESREKVSAAFDDYWSKGGEAP